MTDDPRNPDDEAPDERPGGAESGEPSPKETFRKTSQIALLMSYDLIDKLRYWEKETLKLPEEEVAKRLGHMVKSVEQLRAAYLTFSDIDL